MHLRLRQCLPPQHGQRRGNHHLRLSCQFLLRQRHFLCAERPDAPDSEPELRSSQSLISDFLRAQWSGGEQLCRGEYYHTALAVANSSALAYPAVTVSAVNGGSSSNVSGHVYLPRTPEAYTHDLDGNLVSDGRWTYTWDAENHLVQALSVTPLPDGTEVKVNFGYDYLGRRIGKSTASHHVGDPWPLGPDTRFVYDGWNLLGEFTVDTLVCAYWWGFDLSG